MMRELLKNLYHLELQNGLTDEEFTFLENQFGKLPKILKEFYSLCGHCEEVLNRQDFWIFPKDYEKWDKLKESRHMLLLNENQSVYIAAILENDLGKENPPVYVSDDFGVSWKLCADSTENFIKAALVYEAVFCAQYSSESYYQLTKDEFHLLEEKLTLLPFHLENWFGTIWLFQNLPDSAVFVIEIDDEYQMLYGAAGKKSFEKLAEILDGVGEEI